MYKYYLGFMFENFVQSNHSYFGRIILDCKRYLSELQSNNISVKFIRRPTNALAHCLAKATSNVSDRILGVDDTSPLFQHVLLNDLI